MLLPVLSISCMYCNHSVQICRGLLLLRSLLFLNSGSNKFAKLNLVMYILFTIDIVEDVPASLWSNIGLVHQLCQLFSLICRVVQRVWQSHPNMRRAEASFVQSWHHKLVVKVISNVDQICISGLHFTPGDHRTTIGWNWLISYRTWLSHSNSDNIHIYSRFIFPCFGCGWECLLGPRFVQNLIPRMRQLLRRSTNISTSTSYFLVIICLFPHISTSVIVTLRGGRRHIIPTCNVFRWKTCRFESGTSITASSDLLREKGRFCLVNHHYWSTVFFLLLFHLWWLRLFLVGFSILNMVWNGMTGSFMRDHPLMMIRWVLQTCRSLLTVVTCLIYLIESFDSLQLT